MTTVNLYIGLNDKDTKLQEISNLDAKARISSILFRYFPNGFTLQECQELYKNKDGMTICENTIKVILLCSINGMIFEIIQDLKRELNQECIVVEFINSAVSFI